MEDFNAKIGKTAGDEEAIGQFGPGRRNDRLIKLRDQTKVMDIMEIIKNGRSHHRQNG